MDSLIIEYDAPNGVYFPGQPVTGKVIIQNREWIKARYLKICIHGGAHTSWSESHRRERTDSCGKSESYNETVNYSATINYLTGESIAWSSTDGTNKLPAGTNIFPFAFSLPVNCPPSYEGCHGHIRYSVHVELDRPWKFNKKSKKFFSVVPAFDLNITPGAINPMVNSASKNTGLIFKKGLVTMTVNLPKRGYVSGEIVPITVTIDNRSKNPVVVVRSKMCQHSHFHASVGHSTHHTGHTHHRNDEKVVAESRRNIEVAANSKQQVVLSMKIPAIVPSFQCPIINVDYSLSVKIDAATTFGNTLKCEFPLIIGTIPIQQMVAMPAGTMPPPPMAAAAGPSAPPYPTMTGQQGPPVYPGAPVPGQAQFVPGAPSAPPASPTGGVPSAPPPSYEESMYGTAKVEDSQPFAPRYPVYNNLEQVAAQAPPLPQKF